MEASQLQLRHITSRFENADKELKETARRLANEQSAKADVEVEFAARRADLEAKFNMDTERLSELERALANLNETLAEQDDKMRAAHARADTAEAHVTQLRAETAELREQATAREESFKKLRMAIAVANTFAGQVGDDEASQGGEDES